MDYCDTVISSLKPRRGLDAGGIRKILTLLLMLLLLHQCITTQEPCAPEGHLGQVVGTRSAQDRTTPLPRHRESLGRVCEDDILYSSRAKVISTTTKDYLSWLCSYS